MKILQTLTILSILYSGASFASEIPFPEQGIVSGSVKAGEYHRSFDLKKPLPGFSGYYLAGRHAQVVEDWKTANHYLDIAARKDPANQELKRRTMVIAMGVGDLEMAANYAKEIVSVDKSDPLARLFLTARALKTKDYAAALTQLSQIEKGGMADFAVPLIKTWVYAAQGQFNIKELKKQPLDAFHAALISKILGREKEVLLFLQDIQKLTSEESAFRLADAFFVMGEFDKAEKIYKALSLKNDSVFIKNRLSAARDKKNPPFFVTDDPQKGIALAILDMAKILSVQDSPDSARIFASIAQNIDPTQEDVIILLAQLYADTGHFKEALDYYDKIPLTSPYAGDVQLRIAEIQESLGNIPQAIEGLEDYYKNNPSVDILIQIADIHRRNENYTHAIVLYNQALSKFGPKVPDSYWFLYYTRGMSYERLGDWPNAEQDFKTALDFRPNDPFVLNYLGYGWAERGINLAKSLEYLERAVARNPNDGHIRDSLGWVLFKQGRFEEAVAPLEKAISFLPYDPVVNEHLGDAYWQVGRMREALFQWQRALNHVEEGGTGEIDSERLQQKLVNGLIPEKTEKVMAAENKIAK